MGIVLSLVPLIVDFALSVDILREDIPLDPVHIGDFDYFCYMGRMSLYRLTYLGKVACPCIYIYIDMIF